MVLQLCQGRAVAHQQSHGFWSCLGVSWSWTPKASVTHGQSLLAHPQWETRLEGSCAATAVEFMQ